MEVEDYRLFLKGQKYFDEGVFDGAYMQSIVNRLTAIFLSGQWRKVDFLSTKSGFLVDFLWIFVDFFVRSAELAVPLQRRQRKRKQNTSAAETSILNKPNYELLS